MRLFLFYIAQLFYIIALQGIRPVVSLYANDLGTPVWLIGILVSSGSLFPMILALTIGKWLDRYGARKVIIIGGIGMFLALLFPVFYANIIGLFISQLFVGLCFVSMLVSFQKTTGNLSGDRDQLVMWLSLTGAIGELLGPLMSGFSYEHYGFETTYSIAAFLTLLTIVKVSLLKKDIWQSGAGLGKKQSNFMSSLKLLKQKNLRKAFIASGIAIYSKDLFVSFFPVYGVSIGLNASTIGVILGLSAGAALLVKILQYQLVKQFGRKSVLFYTLLLSGVSLAMLPFFHLLIPVILLSILMGAGLSLSQPLSLIYTLNYSAKDRQGEILGMRLTFNRGAQFIAPIFFGAIGGIAGLFPLFLSNGIFLIIGAFVTQTDESKKEK